MWLYKDKVINCIDLMPQDVFGFIYQVTYLPTNEKYLGKKFVFFNKKLPPLKGFKRKRKISIESDWKKYYGSHDKIKSLLKENKHDDFKREILEFAFNKKQLTYLETKYLFNNNVLENNEFINDNILGKFFRKDLV
tara:strand:- start:19 stop:426 length:408 start_codon:yes stop_codon:yes gene_type:complete